MLRHVVMWKIKENDGEKSKDEILGKIKSDLENLSIEIPDILDIEVGINIEKSDAAFDIVLISTFQNQSGLDTYLTHAAHQKVAQFIGDVRLERVVVDYEL